MTHIKTLTSLWTYKKQLCERPMRYQLRWWNLFWSIPLYFAAFPTQKLCYNNYLCCIYIAASYKHLYVRNSQGMQSEIRLHFHGNTVVMLLTLCHVCYGNYLGYSQTVSPVTFIVKLFSRLPYDNIPADCCPCYWLGIDFCRCLFICQLGTARLACETF